MWSQLTIHLHKVKQFLKLRNMEGTSNTTITFVTGNPKKLEEMKHILEGTSLPVNWVSKNIDLPELQGEPEEIVTQKCKLAAEKINGPVIVEDVCLGFNALKGLPGPYIKWFLKKLGHEGLNKMLDPYSDKTGYALCTYGLSWGPSSEPILFIGKHDGKIVPKRGPENFGWDPIFEPDGHSQTYAELPPEIKNKISHRRKALDQLKDYLEKKFAEDKETATKKQKTES